MPNCPLCNGEMYDNRFDKKNPKSPDYKCKNPDCIDPKTQRTTAIWLPKGVKPASNMPQKVLVATRQPNLAQNNNDLKKFILNNACALTIKIVEHGTNQGAAYNEMDFDAILERRIKAIAGMMMGLDI